VRYCTNASFTAGVAHIPTILYGPGSVRHAHIVDEYVEIAQLTAAVKGYAAIVSAVLVG
jgi:acetylornithine deacetylase/succinyl-diaminopimelate desuccinylase-like protein